MSNARALYIFFGYQWLYFVMLNYLMRWCWYNRAGRVGLDDQSTRSKLQSIFLCVTLSGEVDSAAFWWQIRPSWPVLKVAPSSRPWYTHQRPGTYSSQSPSMMCFAASDSWAQRTRWCLPTLTGLHSCNTVAGTFYGAHFQTVRLCSIHETLQKYCFTF